MRKRYEKCPIYLFRSQKYIYIYIYTLEIFTIYRLPDIQRYIHFIQMYIFFNFLGCCLSAGYIRNHLTYSGLTDRVFDLTDVAVWIMLKKIAEKAGIEKPVSAHKFRHSQATDMVLRGYNDSIIRKKLGWSQDSKVVSRYTHLCDNDVIDATLAMAGTEIPKKPIETMKQAESLKIANASMQLSKLSEDNKALTAEILEMKEQRKSFEADMEDMKKMREKFEEFINLYGEKGISKITKTFIT